MSDDAPKDESSPDNNVAAEEEDPHIVLEVNLLRLPECFIYRIPPMRSADGHRAEDWNLASPLSTCALDLTRRDDALLVRLLASRPKENGPPGSTEQYLFAQSTIVVAPHHDDNSANTLTHWVESVIDSSRYFVLRIQNEKTKREAHIGMGFRERDDAINFKMGCMDYVKAVEREAKAEELSKLHMSEELEQSHDAEEDEHHADHGVSKLSLKEGEKIHVNLPTGANHHREKKHNMNLVGKGGLLLKKPPPSGTVSMSKDEHPVEPEGQETPPKEPAKGIVEEEDEWGDFESSEATS